MRTSISQKSAATSPSASTGQTARSPSAPPLARKASALAPQSERHTLRPPPRRPGPVRLWLAIGVLAALAVGQPRVRAIAASRPSVCSVGVLCPVRRAPTGPSSEIRTHGGDGGYEQQARTG